MEQQRANKTNGSKRKNTEDSQDKKTINSERREASEGGREGEGRAGEWDWGSEKEKGRN